MFGGLGVVFLGAVGVLRKVLILGLWPVGAMGMWRFTKPVGSRRARIVATVAYVIVPLPANAMAEARWGGLVAYATVPWSSASWPPPVGSPRSAISAAAPGPGCARDRCCTGWSPSASSPLWPPSSSRPSSWWVIGCAVALVLGGLLTGQATGAGRVLAVGVGGALSRWSCNFPGACRPPTAGRPWSG